MSSRTYLAFLISFLLAAGSSRAGAARPFRVPKLYPSGDYPVAAAVQDVNDDGFADIVTANVNDGTVSVFLNDGKSDFAPANTFSVGAGAVEVAIADLNGDGKLDLVVTDGNKSVYVALGNGDGTFAPATTSNVPNHPRGIAVGDFNGDGVLDLGIAVFGTTKTYDGQVAVLIGHGDGTFAAAVFYGVGSQNAFRLTSADLNNDGKLDLAVAIQHNTHAKDGLAILLGNGDGTFQPAVTSVTANGSDVVAADLNGDGKMDLALATSSAGRVSNAGLVDVILGNGDGTFQPPVAYSSGGTANQSSNTTMNVVDMNGDGFLDLVVGGGFTAILLGDGTGSFGPPTLYAAGLGLARVGYFNADRIPDVVGNGVVAGVAQTSIAIAFGRAHGALNAPRGFAVGDPALGSYFIEDLASADFDNDGYDDVLVAGESQIFFERGEGDGTVSGNAPIADLQAKALVTADFNGDGNQDIIATTFNGNAIFFIAGKGDGTFQAPVAIQVGSFLFDGFLPVVGDFNHDGNPDVALTDFGSKSLYILLQNGDGTFQPATRYPTSNGPVAPVVADFNRDGNLDLGVPYAPGFSVYLGHGDGTFASPVATTVANVNYLNAGDVDGDGKPDVVAGGSGTPMVVLLGQGDGTFGPPTTIDSSSSNPRLVDIDGDGRLDIVDKLPGNTFLETPTLFRGQGDGTFRPPVQFPTVGVVDGFTLGDLNGDGAPEVIFNYGANAITVLLNVSRR